MRQSASSTSDAGHKLCIGSVHKSLICGLSTGTIHSHEQGMHIVTFRCDALTALPGRLAPSGCCPRVRLVRSCSYQNPKGTMSAAEASTWKLSVSPQQPGSMNSTHPDIVVGIHSSCRTNSNYIDESIRRKKLEIQGDFMRELTHSDSWHAQSPLRLADRAQKRI